MPARRPIYQLLVDRDAQCREWQSAEHIFWVNHRTIARCVPYHSPTSKRDRVGAVNTPPRNAPVIPLVTLINVILIVNANQTTYPRITSEPRHSLERLRRCSRNVVPESVRVL